ncbi:hypothetical protein NC651_012038 [Populus alba x Populus x berolinensis]|nr:hypothetical protein NC651_012038 [Populus alba x Populus x berolinensis]
MGLHFWSHKSTLQACFTAAKENGDHINYLLQNLGRELLGVDGIWSHIVKRLKISSHNQSFLRVFNGRIVSVRSFPSGSPLKFGFLALNSSSAAKPHSTVRYAIKKLLGLNEQKSELRDAVAEQSRNLQSSVDDFNACQSCLGVEKLRTMSKVNTLEKWWVGCARASRWHFHGGQDPLAYLNKVNQYQATRPKTTGNLPSTTK